ncbi:ABC transporter ATP-binding protein [Pseudorhodoplanes sinuspersici]|uniref:Sulfonate ABC transporter ATP-binding protein n=1 Tax=Pseudorhodoplanes sinuspersici TaxID=1235591 RepID=A0A1W6ZLJ5_9HYPH|nr:ABC transporter ATP-binding protein [Pseudorhodoplanes sinuspersici]ARP98303.1 sulfonate ABC transporter ATP-binding protein [Pseudorhodoplanes sinuspersici]RKE65958.1 NitT/TauT family transport system ATP-binding protein [Pseudorhodoplanes sinuspersici]
MLNTVTSFAARTEPLRQKKPHAVDTGLVEIDRVSVVFGKGRNAHTAVQETSIRIAPGEFVCILGPSGCGKSTLLNTVAGYVKPAGGEVRVDGDLVTKPGPDRGMVFQQYSLFPWKTVKENVAFGPKIAGLLSEPIANTFLDMVGLTRFANRYPAELSGGMQQRVGIARALANYPRVLLMDEPFGALDAQTRLMMQENLLKIWAEFGTTVLFITHDVDEAIFLADRVLIMSASPGRIIADLAVNLPRPRLPEVTAEPAFAELKRQCIAQIRAESLKAFEQQNR